MICEPVGICVVVATPRHTKNLFGPITEIAGQSMDVIERSSRGDCLCLFGSAAAGHYLVDVDHRDVVAYRPVGRVR